MRTVLVVCGAGASSTFLALAMRRLAAAKGIALRIEPVGEGQLTARVPHADAVLVGPQLAARFPALSAQVSKLGARAVLLPDGDVGAAGAERALGFAVDALDGSSDPTSALLLKPTLPAPTTTRTE